MATPKDNSLAITVWESDGVDVLTDIGWTNGVNKRFFFTPKNGTAGGCVTPGDTFTVEDIGGGLLPDLAWFQLNTTGWDWLELQGDFNLVDKGGLTALNQSQHFRIVGLRSGYFIDDPDLYPQPVTGSPITYFGTQPTKENDHNRMTNLILSGKADTGAAVGGGEGIEINPYYGSSQVEIFGGIIDHDNLVNGARSNWSVSLSERFTYDASANVNVARSEAPGVKRTDQVFFAACINNGTPTGDFTTTKVKGKLVAILHKN